MVCSFHLFEPRHTFHHSILLVSDMALILYSGTSIPLFDTTWPKNSTFNFTITHVIILITMFFHLAYVEDFPFA